MDRSLTVAVVALVALAARAYAVGLRIHTFDVGQAMSQLIVFPSGYTVLLDTPELSAYYDDKSRLVASRIRSITGGNTIDVAVATHLHLDHIGFAKHGGMWGLLEKQGIVFKKFVERDSGIWKDSNMDGKCTANEIVWHNVGTLSATATEWLCYSTDPNNNNIYPVRELVKLCSTTQIHPPDAGASVTVVAADAYGAVDPKGIPVQGDHSKDALPPSENDYSIGIVVRFGAFTYSAFGDLDGDYAISEYNYTYHDIEATVMKRVGETDVYNVNHHGSSHSSSKAFVTKLNPSVAIVSCGKNNPYSHPDQKTLDKLNPIADVYMTEDGNPKAQYGKAVVANSDIIITTDDKGSSYTVKAGQVTRQYASKGATQPKCTL